MVIASPALKAAVTVIRIGLSLYLALSAAVGPCLCCCLPSDVLALCKPVKQPACHEGCSHHHAHHGKHPTHSKQAPCPSFPAPQRDCPCKQNPTNLAVLPEQVSTPSGDFGPGAQTANAVTASTPINTTENVFSTQHFPCYGPAVETPGEIVRALHILRC